MSFIDNITKFSGDFNELTYSVGNLRYDKLSKFYFSLFKYEKDEEKKSILHLAYDQMQDIWNICKDKDNSKHPTEVVGFNGSIDELAKLITELSLSYSARFYFSLSENILNQSKNDKEIRHPILSKKLYNNFETLKQIYS